MIVIIDTNINSILYKGKELNLLNLSAFDLININGIEYRVICKGYNFQTKAWCVSVKIRDK